MASRRDYFVGYWDENHGWQIYTYFGQVQYGSEEGAQGFLDYVNRQAPGKAWEIVWIPAKEGV